MSMSRETTFLHEQFESAPPHIQWAVDVAYDRVRKTFEDFGFDVSNTDPAEGLVAAIYKYLIDSAVPDKEVA